MRRALWLAVLGTALGLAAQRSLAQDVALSLHPSEVVLDSARAVTRFVVVAIDAAGIARDATAEAELAWSTPDVATIDARGRIRGTRDGSTELRARLAGAEASCRVTVRAVDRATAVSFRNDVIPVLTRAGCNSGACHGSASGKNGFGLSLFGFDPARDHAALTRDYRGRRTDLAEPGESLVLLKPTRQVQHKGGLRLDPDGELYALVRAWIGDGAGDDGAAASPVVGLSIEPREAVLAGAVGLPLVVTARYADGSTRDVTELALLSSSSDTVATVDEHGVVTARDRGETFVMARFMHLAEVTQVVVVPDAAPIAPFEARPHNEIDEFVHEKLAKLRLVPAPVCDDRTFVRRVYLDVIGKLPTADEVARFVDDPRDDRRSHLVDELLERPEFAEVQAASFAEVLRIESQQLKPKGVQVYTDFLREAFQRRVPLDQLARELLTASGSNFEQPATNYWVVDRDPKVVAEATAQVFFGIRLQCAQCHNHPFERWTMDDYYGFAAFFAQVGAKAGEDPRERVVFDARRGEVRNPRDNAISKPRFLGGAEPAGDAGADRRAVLAAWLTARDNPWFAEHLANRVWARLFGRGLVEPVDDRRVSNPPSHPALAAWLGRTLADSGFDVRALVRVICASRTYQLASRDDGVPAAAYAGAPVRRLGAEQLLDAIDRVTGVPSRLRGVPPGASAVRATDGNPGNRFLDLFGRPRRTSVCTCDRRDDPTLNQVLHLINGDTIDEKVRADGGRLAQALAAGASPDSIVTDLFVAAYARPPRVDEAVRVLAAVAAAADTKAAWQDVYWAVLNSKEFLFQH